MTLIRGIVGSNPLTGTTHSVSDRERLAGGALAPRRMTEILVSAVRSGAVGVTFTAGDAVQMRLADVVAATGTRLLALPIIPRAGLIGEIVNRGPTKVGAEYLSALGWGNRTALVAHGTWTALTGRALSLVPRLVEAEMNRIIEEVPEGIEVPSILFHEIVTDAMVSLDARELVREIVLGFKDCGEIWPGFVTRNLARFQRFMLDCNVDLRSIFVMAPFNPIGFQMSPDLSSAEQSLSAFNRESFVAMSIFAAGRVPPTSGVEYIRRLGIRNAAVGVSSSTQASETFRLLGVSKGD